MRSNIGKWKAKMEMVGEQIKSEIDSFTNVEIKIKEDHHERKRIAVKKEFKTYDDHTTDVNDKLMKIEDSTVKFNKMKDGAKWVEKKVSNDEDFIGDTPVELDSEVWLKSAYPLLYHEYLKSNEQIMKEPFSNLCKVCNLRPFLGIYYGIKACESERQFLKRTFHGRIIYPVCEGYGGKSCPPTTGGYWCRYCRLKKCLQSGVKIKLIQYTEANLIRKAKNNLQRKTKKIIYRANDSNGDPMAMVGEQIISKIDRFVKIKEEDCHESKTIAVKKEFKTYDNHTRKVDDKLIKSEDWTVQFNKMKDGDKCDNSLELDSEVWLKSAYPLLYQDYVKSEYQTIRESLSNLCKVCNLRPYLGIYYGIKACESERHFLKRTFHERIIYPMCEGYGRKACPPTTERIWCRYCRLKKCIQSGIKLKLIQNTEVNLIKTKKRIKERERRKKRRANESNSDPFDATEWVRDNYPSLYQDYLNCTKPVLNKSSESCTICHLRPSNGKHYGIYCCESDKQFLKRTFHGKLIYPECEDRQFYKCLPQEWSWCQYCRLGECLKTGLNLGLIRVNKSKINKSGENVSETLVRFSASSELLMDGMKSIKDATNKMSKKWLKQELTDEKYPKEQLHQKVTVKNTIRPKEDETIPKQSILRNEMTEEELLELLRQNTSSSDKENNYQFIQQKDDIKSGNLVKKENNEEMVKKGKNLVNCESTDKKTRISCNQCGKWYAKNSYLKRHQQIFHEGIRYPCDQCHYIVREKSRLIRHIKSKHNKVLLAGMNN